MTELQMPAARLAVRSKTARDPPQGTALPRSTEIVTVSRGTKGLEKHFIPVTANEEALAHLL